MSRREDELVSAPLGAAMLDRLEGLVRRRRNRERFDPFLALPGTRDDDVAVAARWAAEATPDELLDVVLDAGDLVGPWHGSAPLNAARALRLAPHRAAIATALLDRADGPITATDLRAEQWWWTDGLPPTECFTDDTKRLGPHFAWVTAPPGVLWTTSPSTSPSPMR